MRPKMTARKSTGARPAGHYLQYLQAKLKAFQRQEETMEQVTDAEGQVDGANVASNNNSKQVLNIVNITPTSAMSSGSKDNVIITAAVGLNDPIRVQQLPVTVVPLTHSETTDAISEPTTEAEQKTADVNSITHPTQSDSKSSPGNVALSERVSLNSMPNTVKVSTDLPSSSRALANEGKKLKRTSRSPDNIALSERVSLNSTPKRVKVSTDSSSSSRALANERKRVKRSSTSPSSQTRKYTKRTQDKQENSCRKLIEKCDKNILFKMLLEELDGEEILEGYKEKRSGWSNQKIKEETFKVLNVNFQANSTDSSKLTSIQNILKEFSNLVGDNLVEAMLKTFGDQLSASKVLEYLKVDDVVAALIQKYTVTELLNLAQTADPFATQKMLEMTSANAVTDLVRSRNDLNTFEPLLIVLLESFSHIVPEEQKEDLENTVNVKSDSKVALITAVYNLVKSKEYLKNSECLLNVVLENGPKILSNENKSNVKNVLLKKFSASELNDLSHEVISFHLAQKVVQIDD